MPKPTTLPFHRAPHVGRRPVCWLYPLVPLDLEKSSFDSSLVLTPFHISQSHRTNLPWRSSSRAQGFPQPVLHPRAKPLHRAKGPKLPDIVRSPTVIASRGQLLPNRPLVRLAPHQDLSECREALRPISRRRQPTVRPSTDVTLRSNSTTVDSRSGELIDSPKSIHPPAIVPHPPSPSDLTVGSSGIGRSLPSRRHGGGVPYFLAVGLKAVLARP
jgi:hypothetical protein